MCNADSPAVDGPSPAAVEEARSTAAAADLVVVKIGTDSLTDADSHLDRVKLDKLVTDIMDLRSRGKRVILVTSGAVGAGIGRLGRETDTIAGSQALSTVGQSHLMRHYTQSFDRYDQMVAQILLTGNDLDTPERFRNFKNTVDTLLGWDVIPIINENDAVATDELQIGDNDMLSASVAIGLDVDLLVTLTDVDGVYTDNPKSDPDAELIEAVGANYEAVQDLVDGTPTARFGGIRTKIEGARDVSAHGIPAVIAGSAERHVLEKIAGSKPVGTIFLPRNEKTDVEN